MLQRLARQIAFRKFMRRRFRSKLQKIAYRDDAIVFQASELSTIKQRYGINSGLLIDRRNFDAVPDG